MTAGQFALGLVRLLAILLPLAVTARSLRFRYLSLEGTLALLVDVVLSLSLLLLAAEALGLVGLDPDWAPPPADPHRRIEPSVGDPSRCDWYVFTASSNRQLSCHFSRIAA